MHLLLECSFDSIIAEYRLLHELALLPSKNRVVQRNPLNLGSKAHPRWLWHAMDHHTGTVLAYVFGRRQDTVFVELKALLEPFEQLPENLSRKGFVPIRGAPHSVT